MKQIVIHNRAEMQEAIEQHRSDLRSIKILVYGTNFSLELIHPMDRTLENQGISWSFASNEEQTWLEPSRKYDDNLFSKYITKYINRVKRSPQKLWR